MSDKKYVQVAVNLPLKDVFDYSVPQDYCGLVCAGKRVWVPFRNKTIVGYIVGVSDSTSIKFTRDIKEVIDKQPLLSKEMLELTRWIADYYFCSWGEAIEAAVAGPFKQGKTVVRVRKDTDAFSSVKTDEQMNPYILTSHQDLALSEITPFIENNKFGVFLLHGITASGKTEVYFGAIEEVLAKDKEVIVFVPEIALTSQALQRFTEKFGKEKVAVIHSRLSKSEKYIEWQRIEKGEAKIVVGARSAIFSPVKNLGLIVVDEEHEHTYKQEDVPRYHLVDTAIKRAEISTGVVILGSATPSLESMLAAKEGRYKLIELPERVCGRDLPAVALVDMRQQSRMAKRPTVLSKALEDSINRCLKNKEQVILFLNRRGFSTFARCSKCGFVLNCPHCNLALVYHFDRRQMLCHHCSYHAGTPEICPECKGNYIKYLGVGTQKVESELHRLFPNASIARMDSDALQKKNAHFEIFDDFKSGKIDIMIGTQMLAKGLDFPNVTLVGVISADVTLNLPDFRACERTFSLLTQVAGRAGRGEISGKVIIQTYTPEHYSIQCAIAHDYNSFYEQEIVFRKQLQLPPYTRMISIALRSKKEELSAAGAQKLAEVLNKQNKKKSLGLVMASPLALSKLKGYFRWVVVIKSKDILKSNALLKNCLRKWRPPSKVRITVDVDPLMVM